MSREKIEVFLEENGFIFEDGDEPLLLADGLDEAFVGVGQRFNSLFAIYDLQKVMDIYAGEGMDRGEAEEWFSFNVAGAWVGEATPCFVTFMKGDNE